MNRQPSRTELFEELNEKALNLRNKSLDTRTLSRAFADLAESVKALPTRGDIWDLAQANVIRRAEASSKRCLELSILQLNVADAMIERGIPE
jgi:hypothetical protein